MIVIVFWWIIDRHNNDKEVSKILHYSRYTQVVLTGNDVNQCNEHDAVAKTFTATDFWNKRVDGVVCGDITHKLRIRILREHKD
jgi:hypothetical protein